MHRARIAALFAVGLALTACQTAEEAAEPGRAIQTARVERDDIVDVASNVGRVEAQRQARVNAELPERIASVHVTLGQTVKQGDPLVTLSGEIQAAGLGQASSALEAARASLELAKSQADRVAVLFEAGTASRADLEAARSQRDAAAAQVGQLSASRTQAAVQRARSVVRAPFDGIVAMLDANEGDLAQPGRALAVVVQPGPMKVLLDVPERDFDGIEAGQPAKVASLAHPDRPVDGVVVGVGQLIDPMTRTGRVEVRIPDGGALLAGAAVRASIETQRRPDALVVPVAAVQLANDFQKSRKATVYRVGEGFASAAEVVLGERLGERYEVVDGLDEGDVIATLGSHLLRDGAPVRVVESGR